MTEKTVGNLGIHVPFGSRQLKVEDSRISVMELVDPSRQAAVYAYNSTGEELQVTIFVDGVEKQTFTMKDQTPLQVLIMSCLPEFQSLGSNPLATWFARTESVTIKAAFSLIDNPSNGTVISVIYRWAPKGQEVPWSEAMKNPRP